LHTLRADIDYGFVEARTTLGRIGVKVWIYKGDILPEPPETEAEVESAMTDDSKSAVTEFVDKPVGTATITTTGQSESVVDKEAAAVDPKVAITADKLVTGANVAEEESAFPIGIEEKAEKSIKRKKKAGDTVPADIKAEEKAEKSIKRKKKAGDTVPDTMRVEE
jgi:hypothetical protein